MSRFQIRRHALDDVDELYAAADESRQHVRKWMGWLTAEFSREDAGQWVEQSISSWDCDENYEHLIIDSEDQRIVGGCGLNAVNRKELVCNLGYWVRASCLGVGAALQATLLLRDLGFEKLGFNRLEIFVAVGNEHSRNVAERTGAHYEGIQRARLRVGGVVHDAHMYALINEKLR